MIGEDEEPGDLLDTALRDEIELVSDLVVAASGSERHFTPEEIDALLGLAADDARTQKPGTATAPNPTEPTP